MRIRLFGAVRLEADGGIVSAGPPAQQKLLALLALRAGHTVPIDRLVEDMWDGQSPANAQQIVRTYVSRLRGLLEPDRTKGAPSQVLATHPGGYRLVMDENDIDLLRFRRLVEDGQSTGNLRSFLEADRLWTDEPLAEFPYDEFAVRLRERLELLRLDAVEQRLALEIEPPVPAAALDELRELVTAHPLRERLWQLLITGLYRTGRQTEAVRAYDRCRAVLGEVGLEPGADLQALKAAVIDQDESLLSSPRKETLPAALDSFVGRVAELEDIAVRLETGRFVTIVGAGGSGKTRLALQVARAWTAGWTFFVDLSPIGGTGAGGVVEALLDAVGEPQRHSRDPLASAVRVLSKEKALLVIDNCEHLLDQVSAVVERLLVDCPELRILATSREALRVRGEALVVVAPMGLPEAEDSGGILASDAGGLFAERARAVDPGFDVRDDNAAAVATILRCVDGMPLAIEMAAMQLQTSEVEQLAVSLRDVFTALGAGRRTALLRHRTLRATLEWSYQLLDEGPQRLFRRLGVLPGDFDADVAVMLGGTPADLHRLVATSMVARAPGRRYRLLVPVRQFAMAVLEEAGEQDLAEADRNDHFVALAEELSGGFRRYGEQQWQQRFAADRINLVAAVDSLHATDPRRSGMIAAAMVPYLSRLGLYGEALRLGERALDDVAERALRSELHGSLAHAASQAGDYDRAEAHLSPLLSHAGEGGDVVRAAQAVNQYGSVLAMRGFIHQAIRVLTEAVSRYERDRPDEWFIPVVNLGAVKVWAGNVDRPAELIERLKRARASGELPDEMVPFVDALRGMRARMAGALTSADELLSTAIDGFRRHRSAFHLAMSRVERAIVRHEMGHPDEAKSILSEVVAAPAAGDAVLHSRLRAVILLATLAFDSGDRVRAAALLREAIEVGLDVGAMGAVVSAGDVAAELAVSVGDTHSAEELLAWGDARRAEIGFARDPAEAARRAGLGFPPVPAIEAPDDITARQVLESVLSACAVAPRHRR
jgi:predicted ATPase/DNA-binding SARP family transcriptional activator